MASYIDNLITFIDRQRSDYEYEPQEGGIVPEGTLDIVENGVYDVRKYAYANVNVEGGSPTPSEPPVKGDIILLDGKSFLVLDANGWECKLMFNGIAGSYYYQPDIEIKTEVDFTTADGTKKGIKYDGSTLDFYCDETFLASLSEDIQNAIIEQEVVQDMFDTNAAEGTEDYIVTGGTFGDTWRIKKVNTEPVVVGNRKIHSLMVDELFDYLGATTTNDALVEAVFGASKPFSIYAWTGSAHSDGADFACDVLGDDGGIGSGDKGSDIVVRPTFSINLEGISWSK